MIGSRARRATLVTSFIVLVSLVFVLIAGLGRLELLPGKPLPSTVRPRENAPIQLQPNPVEPPSASGLIPLLLVVGAAAIIAILISDREFRRRVLRALIMVALLLVALVLAKPFVPTAPPSGGTAAPAAATTASAAGRLKSLSHLAHRPARPVRSSRWPPSAPLRC